MKLFEKKVILITGGTGSFGKTITEYLLDYNLKEIRVFSRDEKKQEDMRLSLNNNKLKFIIGDVRDYNSIYDVTTISYLLMHDFDRSRRKYVLYNNIFFIT